MQIRDRIKELRRVRASDLRPNGRNWREHTPRQRKVLSGVLEQVGYADALLARELDDGSLELIDGHLRAQTTPEQMVPVLVLDVDQHEADLILATHDPLASLAGTDEAKLGQLLDDLSIDDSVVKEMIAGVIGRDQKQESHQKPVKIKDIYQVIAECNDEPQQREAYELLTSAGYECRVLTFEI